MHAGGLGIQITCMTPTLGMGLGIFIIQLARIGKGHLNKRISTYSFTIITCDCAFTCLLSHSRASVAEFFALVLPSVNSLLTMFFRVRKRSGPVSNFFWSFCRKRKIMIHITYMYMYTIPYSHHNEWSYGSKTL